MGLQDACQSGPATDLKFCSHTAAPGPRCTCSYVSYHQGSRRDRDSKFAYSYSNFITLQLIIDPPYIKHPKVFINDLGLPDKKYYKTQDVCQILGVSGETFRARIRHGHYPEMPQIGGKRFYTYNDIKKLKMITRDLYKKKIIKIGIP